MTSAEDLNEIEFSMALHRRYSVDIAQGDTTPAARKLRVRELIIARGEANLPMTNRATGKSGTLAEKFAAVYGEPLFPVEHHETNDGQ